MKLRLQFEGIRCFATRQTVEVRPLTLLVGENSSGKSTFLALNQIASNIAREAFQRKSFFNDPPFLLGAFDQIASYRSGKSTRARSLKLSVCVEDEERGSGSMSFVFAPENGQAVLKTLQLSTGPLTLEAKLGLTTDIVKFEGPKGTATHEMNRFWLERFHPLMSDSMPVPWFKDIGNILTKTDFQKLRDAWNLVAIGTKKAYAFAPIRTRPKRTYDPVRAEPEPEGSHVPMLLANLSALEDGWMWPKRGLSEFGADSGLFDEIEVVRKGEKESDPFQIGVRVAGPVFNLVDVGYGVSQVLPIIVDILQRPSTPLQRPLAAQVFLLQQPEVHLHPRAQAELGSFLAKRAGRQRFVVETHSDYIVDRVRMEVRRGRLKPSDVSLLYFERQKHGAMIHQLELDERGSIVNPPPGYRQFFMDEERKLLDF